MAACSSSCRPSRYVMVTSDSVVFTRSGILVVAVIIASGFLGSWTTTSASATPKPRTQQARKFVGQLLIAAVFAVLSIDWVHTSTNCHSPVLATGWN